MNSRLRSDLIRCKGHFASSLEGEDTGAHSKASDRNGHLMAENDTGRDRIGRVLNIIFERKIIWFLV